MNINKTKQAKKQAFKDMKDCGIVNLLNSDKYIRKEGFNNPGFKRNSYNPV